MRVRRTRIRNKLLDVSGISREVEAARKALKEIEKKEIAIAKLQKEMEAVADALQQNPRKIREIEHVVAALQEDIDRIGSDLEMLPDPSSLDDSMSHTEEIARAINQAAENLRGV